MTLNDAWRGVLRVFDPYQALGPREPHADCLPVVTRDGQEGPGIEVLAHTFNLSWDAAGLGPARFSNAQIRRLARLSSGEVWEFLLLIYEAALSARRRGHSQVTDLDVSTAVQLRMGAYETTLTSACWNMLERVLATREWQPQGADLGPLRELYVARYVDADGVWFRPKELLIDALMERLGRKPVD